MNKLANSFALAFCGIIAIAGACSSDGATDTGSARTVDNCETNIGANVPAFYKNWFRCADISMSGNNVVIKTIGLPPHKSYYYGEGHSNYEAFDYSRGNQYKPNPNRIGDQDLTITIPTNPKAAGATISDSTVDGVSGNSNQEYTMGPAGVALDSVVMFNPLAAPGDDIENEKYTFDSYSGHPAGTTYHYHTTTAGPLEVVQRMGSTTSTTPGSASVEVYGVMCDGTVVMGCTEADGSAPNSGNFDAQNGHVHDIKDKSGATLLANRYHTHICPSKFTKHKFTPEIRYYSTCNVK